MRTKYHSIPLARAGDSVGRTLNNHLGLRQFALRLGKLTLIAVCALFPAAPSQAADTKAPYITVGRGRSDLSKTLTWDGGPDHPYAEVWVSTDGADETFVVEQGKGTRRVTVEPGKSYLYILTDAGQRLATVPVTADQSPATAPTPAPVGTQPSKSSAATDITACVGRWSTMRKPGGDFEITFELAGGGRLKGRFLDRKNAQNNGRILGTLYGNVLTYQGEQSGAIKLEGAFTMLTGVTLDGQGVARTVVGEKKFSWTGSKMPK